MIQKLIPVLVGLIIGICPLTAFASETGSIEVSLPEDMAGEYVTFIREETETQKVCVDKTGKVKAEGLQEGNYVIEIPETDDYMFLPIQVHVPCWSDEEKQMLYDINIIPKYSVKEKPIPVTPISDPAERATNPKTGDFSHGIKYMNVGIISLIILVIMSCHNRFDCDTMTGKYSKNGGQNNGNDNDTENPRSTRRIGISSSGSID